MSSDSPEIKPSSDEAWKEHVKAEDARFDQKPVDSSATAGESGSLPPADFPALVQMFSTQALVALGVLQHPVTGKSEPQLPVARHFIDLLGVIEARTAGNLSADERSMLGGTLHYLRMSYIELSKRPGDQKK